MKLLGWMHRKLQKNSIDPFKDFTIGNCCKFHSAHLFEDDDSQTKPGFCSEYGSNSFQQSKVSSLKTKKTQEIFEEATSIVNSELFHGFLSIGTFGSEPIISNPATPTFRVYLENLTEKETDVTEKELQLINDELEKLFEAEAEEDGEESLISSCRNSHVSTITLSGKQMDGFDAEYNGKMIACPLQGYLFGSSIELPETRSEPRKEKATLGELFLKTNLIDEKSTNRNCRKVKQDMQTNKSPKKMIDKMLKKFHVSSKSSIPCSKSDAAESVPTKKKLLKILQFFYKKVHPEAPILNREPANSPRNNKTLNNTSYTNGDVMSVEKHERGLPYGKKLKEGSELHDNLKVFAYEPTGSISNGSRECWIKTDSDYLVLEL